MGLELSFQTLITTYTILQSCPSGSLFKSQSMTKWIWNADNMLKNLQKIKKITNNKIVPGVDRISTDLPGDNTAAGLLDHLGVEDARDHWEHGYHAGNTNSDQN